MNHTRAVEYKIYWPKAGRVELSMPVGDGWRLYLYRSSKQGRVWFEAKLAKPRQKARWLNPRVGRDSVFTHHTTPNEAELFSGLTVWLEDVIEPLTLSLFMLDLREVWTYAEEDKSYRRAQPPITDFLKPNANAVWMAQSLASR